MPTDALTTPQQRPLEPNAVCIDASTIYFLTLLQILILKDYVTPFATIEVSEFNDGKWKGFIEECYKGYEGTPIVTDYPIDTFFHDWKLMTIGFWSFVIPILTGAAALPPGDKRDFTWEKFYPVAGGRFCSIVKELDLFKVAKDYLGEK